ncbi:MAG: ribosomal L7Ae/L30e/S12e/Gadd45 family protein [Clostridia bacterium]|nr:ribosomal L7Ae/L30e/S12e/Gadd45 family protein [Clostridia bacterium]
MHNSKLLSMLGLARRAGKLSLGHDAVMEDIARGRAQLIVLAADASARVEREMQRELLFQKSRAKLVRTKYTMEQMGTALPHKVGVVSVNDASFAGAVLNIYEED